MIEIDKKQPKGDGVMFEGNLEEVVSGFMKKTKEDKFNLKGVA